jgi:hypothetical protein
MYGGYGGDAVRDGVGVGHDADLNTARRVPRKLTLVLINGQKLRLSFGDFWQIITDRYSLIYFLVADGLVAYLYPGDKLTGLPWWHVVTVFVVMAFVVIAALTGLFAIPLRLLHRFDQVVIPAPLLVFCAVAVMEMVKVEYAYYVWGPDWPYREGVLEAFVREYIYFLMLEILYSIFVIPHARAYSRVTVGPRASFGSDVGASQPQAVIPFRPGPRAGAPLRPAPVPVEPRPVEARRPRVAVPKPAANTSRAPVKAPPPSASITLAGEKIELRKLQTIRAEEHYIRITTSEGERMLRHRIKDAVALIPDACGLQVHRSLWIAFPTVERCAPSPDGKLLIVLRDGSEIGVPRARRRAVEARLKEGRRFTSPAAPT